MIDGQTFEQMLLIFAAGLIAGGVNALAGGGTIISYPALVALGLPPVVANASSMVALWPGSVGSCWGFRREIRTSDSGWTWLILPSLIGGISGAVLLERLPGRVFEGLAHWLVLGASILIAAEPIFRRRSGERQSPRVTPLMAAILVTVIGVYGGYFGAGMGILLLPILALAGTGDIHTANGLKNLFMTGNKGVAALYLALSGLVSWSSVLPMAAGAIVGGWAAASVGRRVPDRPMRVAIVVLGVSIFLWLVFGRP